MPSTPDFPAAHSMDTAWCAVDRDGHVALFDSGENGAVAEGSAALDAGGPDDLALSDLAPTDDAPAPAVHDWDGYRRGAHTRHESEYLAPTDAAMLLMFVRDVGDLDDDVRAGRATPVATTRHAAVRWRADATDAIARAHERSLCLRCVVLNTAVYGERRPGDAGLYLYQHRPDHGTPLPYVRTELPVRPLTLDAIPAAVRDRVGAVRFDALCFADALAVQPFEHVPSFAYGSGHTTYVDAAGDERPIPGHARDGET